VELRGSWRVAPADDELRRVGIGIDYDDRGWAETAVPSHWRDHPALAGSDGPVLYRTRFEHEPPGDGERLFVTLEGVFYQADVWLDGAYLGDPEGYFTPHSFDVTSLARLGAEHVLAVEVTCPPQRGDRGKRTLTGAFQRSDAVQPGWNPGGLWRPVRLERTGPVRLDRCRVLCRDANDARAHLRVSARLDSDAPRRAHVRTFVDDVVVADQEQSLARGSNEVAWNFDIADPRLWWPWTMGDQPLTEVRVEIVVDGVVSHRHVARTGLREVALDHWTFTVNGERLFAKGIELGPTRQSLALATPEELRHDVALAREVGLDLVRVRGHVTRREVYEAADELGVLVWQDLPLQGGYARSVRREAVAQARAAVDLLGHHPSIVVWCGHDAPEPGGVRQQVPTWNTSVLDRWVKRALERADETRPVVAHSGIPPHLPRLDGTDSHLRFGWEHGDERDLPGFAAVMPRMVRFVGRFGAPSAPEDAAWVEPERWPDLDWARLRHDHGLDPEVALRHVPADEHPTYASWAHALQRHQADVLRFQIEALRRLKYRPTGGFCCSMLGDSTQMFGEGILDDRRRPKLAFQAVTDACRPVVVVADRLPALVVPGAALALDVHVVSDVHRLIEGMVCTASLRWAGGGHTWRWTGDVPPDECVRVGTVQLLVPDAPGELWLDLAVEHGEEVATNRYEATILAPRPAAPPASDAVPDTAGPGGPAATARRRRRTPRRPHPFT